MSQRILRDRKPAQSSIHTETVTQSQSLSLSQLGISSQAVTSRSRKENKRKKVVAVKKEANDSLEKVSRKRAKSVKPVVEKEQIEPICIQSPSKRRSRKTEVVVVVEAFEMMSPRKKRAEMHAMRIETLKQAVTPAINPELFNHDPITPTNPLDYPGNPLLVDFRARDYHRKTALHFSQPRIENHMKLIRTLDKQRTHFPLDHLSGQAYRNGHVSQRAISDDTAHIIHSKLEVLRTRIALGKTSQPRESQLSAWFHDARFIFASRNLDKIRAVTSVTAKEEMQAIRARVNAADGIVAVSGVVEYESAGDRRRRMIAQEECGCVPEDFQQVVELTHDLISVDAHALDGFLPEAYAYLNASPANYYDETGKVLSSTARGCVVYSCEGLMACKLNRDTERFEPMGRFQIIISKSVIGMISIHCRTRHRYATPFIDANVLFSASAKDLKIVKSDGDVVEITKVHDMDDIYLQFFSNCAANEFISQL